MTTKFDELVAKLKEIFQIDKPELDFGIYKIVNAKADMIQKFLTNDLKAKVQAALADKAGAGIPTMAISSPSAATKKGSMRYRIRARR